MSWGFWLPENRRSFEHLRTRTLSTWRRSWSRSSSEMRRTSRLVSRRSNGDACGIDEGLALRLRTVTAEPIPAVSQPLVESGNSTASAISRIDFRKSILCR